MQVFFCYTTTCRKIHTQEEFNVAEPFKERWTLSDDVCGGQIKKLIGGFIYGSRNNETIT